MGFPSVFLTREVTPPLCPPRKCHCLHVRGHPQPLCSQPRVPGCGTPQCPCAAQGSGCPFPGSQRTLGLPPILGEGRLARRIGEKHPQALGGTRGRRGRVPLLGLWCVGWRWGAEGFVPVNNARGTRGWQRGSVMLIRGISGSKPAAWAGICFWHQTPVLLLLPFPPRSPFPPSPAANELLLLLLLLSQAPFGVPWQGTSGARGGQG